MRPFGRAAAGGTWRRAGASAALLALAGCGTRPAPAPASVVYDLAERAPIAEFHSAWDVLLFGTPAAEAGQEKGFRKQGGAAGFCVATTRRPQVFLRFPEVAPRRALIDIEPYPELLGQTARLFLNADPLAPPTLALEPGRQRYLLELPEASQRPSPRGNRLRFEFERTTTPADPEETPLAARFHSLVVGLASDPTLADLASPGAPAPIDVGKVGGIPTLAQAGPSALRLVLRLPQAAELRFTPRRHAAARTTVPMSVTLEDAAGSRRVLWQADVGDAASEVRLPLPGPAGALVALSLEVGGATPTPRTWGVWSAPRVMGAGEGDPLRPGRLSDPDQRRADALRQALKGVNVLFVILDAAGARHFGCYGYGRNTTPEIDRIAAEGVVFEQAYTPAVFTRSAMASVWTSQYPDQHHADLRYDAKLPSGRLTLAELLSAQGVPAAAFVANPSAGRAFGLDRGFAEFHEIYKQPVAGGLARADAFRPVLHPWLQARTSAPFFAYAHFREPHFPYDPPAPYTTQFGPDAPLSLKARREGGWQVTINAGKHTPTADELAHLVRLYDGNLAYVDHEVGELRRVMEAKGLWENTVVIVAADHGEALYEHGFIGHNEQLYQDSAHIPLIVRFPKGRGPQGLRIAELVDLLDVAPTVADVFGVLGKGGSERTFHGRSLLPLVTGAPGKRAMVARTTQEKPTYGLVDGRYKFLYDVYTGAEQLYDVSADPGETHDLLEREPLRAALYRQSLHLWMLSLKGGEAATERAKLTPEELESLHALGYIN